MNERSVIVEYIKNELAADYVEEYENQVIFIWNNMEFKVDFDSNRYSSSKWSVSGNLENMKNAFDVLQDNIAFTEEYGVLDKKTSVDLVWNRTGW